MPIYTGGSAYGNYGAYEKCHIGPVEVMKIGETVIWAGRFQDMDGDLDWDMRIKLNDSFALRPGVRLVTADGGAEKLLSPEVTSLTYPPTLYIDWEDFSAPPLDREWWQALIGDLEKMGPAGVALYCQGGHGRTGTALAILASLSGQTEGEKGDCVSWVRRHYCHEAVESFTQIDYIQEITGEEITSQPTSQIKWREKEAMKSKGIDPKLGYDPTQYALATTWENPREVTKIGPETTMFNKNASKAAVQTLKKGHKR